VTSAAIQRMLITEQLRDFAKRYTAAWCSHMANDVAAFFSPEGSLTVNDGPPARGRNAIAEVAQGFISAFPDIQVFMDDLSAEGNRLVYRWTFTGTNNGPGGIGKRVRINGFEEWRIGADGLIAESHGHFDTAEYQRQLEHGAS
jgi:predicted ester cyclase